MTGDRHHGLALQRRNLLPKSAMKGYSMSNSRIQQSSNFTPAVCSHNGLLHAVFVANNDSQDLLHIVSADGISWTRKNNVRQSTRFAPAIMDFHGTLQIVFVANNLSNDLLACTYEDERDNWSDNRPLGESSKHGPALGIVGTSGQNGGLTEHLLMYFVADNDSNDLLVTEVDSFNVPFKDSETNGRVPIHIPGPTDHVKETPPIYARK
jgi:hypothetical protein